MQSPKMKRSGKKVKDEDPIVAVHETTHPILNLTHPILNLKNDDSCPEYITHTYNNFLKTMEFLKYPSSLGKMLIT